MNPITLPPTGLLEGLAELYASGLPKGSRTGWPSVDRLYRPLPGQLTVVTGWPGSGKSEWLDALLLNLARQGWRHAIFSPENHPVHLHLVKYLEKFVGKPFDDGPTPRMSLEEAREAATEIDDWFGFMKANPFVKREAFAVEEVLAEAEGWFRQRGLLGGENRLGLVIDPWNELEHLRPAAMSETEYVSVTLTTVRLWSRRNRVHVWLVAHPQKLRREEGGHLPIPRPDSISGCHDAQTEVLTTRGWVPHSQVTLFDRVACFDAASGRASYQRPSSVWEHNYVGEMVRLASPSFDALVTPNHRMVVRPNWRRKPSVARRLVMSGIGRPVAYPMDEQWSFILADEIVDGLEMPWATAFEDAPDAPMSDDMLRFLGWWIAEGWYVKKTGGIGICQADGPLAQEMRATLDRMGVRYSSRVSAPSGKGKLPMWVAYVWRSEFTQQVAQMCGVGAASKRLPEFTWRLSSRQKRVLLHALMDGDGHWYRNRPDSGVYATTSSRLADEVQRLAIELGQMAVVSSRDGAMAHHKRRYAVVVGNRQRRSISLRKSRHVSHEHYEGKVYCLTVPTGAYFVRRNGKPGIYGNSQHWWNKADNCVTVHREQAEGNQEVEIHVQKVRFKHLGRAGVATLRWDRVSGRYHEPMQTIRKAVGGRDD